MDSKTNILYKNLAVCFTLFLLYACLVPFRLHFSLAELQVRFNEIKWMPYFINGRRVSLTDLVSNIALFLPLGFLVTGALYNRFKPSMLILISSMFGFALSSALETLQLLTTIRIPSISDVCSNTLGSCIGSITYCVYHNKFGTTVKPFLIARLKKPLYELYAYAVFLGILFYQLMPFDVTLDLGDIKNAVKFSLSHPQIVLPLRYMQSSGNNFIFFTTAAYIFYSVFLRHISSSKKIFFTILSGIIVVFSIEFIQLFIVSRGSNISNIFFGMLGIFHGLVWCKYFHLRKTRLQNIRLFFTLNYCLFFVFNYFFPFRLTDTISSNVSWYSIIPFASYFVTITISSVADLLAQIFLFIPIGCFLARYPRLTITQIAVIGCGAAALCELSHCVIATRFCDVTDVISAGAGCVLGYYWIHRFISLRTVVKRADISS